jgi:hypothetical protein
MWPIMVPCDAFAGETLPHVNTKVTAVERLQRHRCPPIHGPTSLAEAKQKYI